MIVLQTELNCSADQQVTLQLPSEIAPGLYKAVLVLEKLDSTPNQAIPIHNQEPEPTHPRLEIPSPQGAKIPPEDQVYFHREMQNMQSEGIDPFEDMGLN